MGRGGSMPSMREAMACASEMPIQMGRKSWFSTSRKMTMGTLEDGSSIKPLISTRSSAAGSLMKLLWDCPSGRSRTKMRCCPSRKLSLSGRGPARRRRRSRSWLRERRRGQNTLGALSRRCPHRSAIAAPGAIGVGRGRELETGGSAHACRLAAPAQKAVRQRSFDADPGELPYWDGLRARREVDDAVTAGAAGLRAGLLAPAGDQDLVILADQPPVELLLDALLEREEALQPLGREEGIQQEL